MTPPPAPTPAAARALDVVAVVLTAALLVTLLVGSVGVGQFVLTRPEDLVVAIVVIVALRLIVAPVSPPTPSGGRAVAVAIAVYLLVMGFIVVSRHRALRTHALDLGQYLQIIWNLAGGRGPLGTLTPTYMVEEVMNAWGDHLSPIFYLLTPTQWLAPGAVSVLLAQTAILAAGALAVFAYARRRVGDGPAAAFALLYLLNPSLHGINIRDIHPAAFAIPLLLAAAAAFDARRYAWCAAALVATLACREDAAVAVVGFALWLAVARGLWRLGAAVAAAAVLLLAIDIAWVMPHFRRGPYNHLNRFQHLGGSLPDILLSIVLRPWRWIAIVLTPAKLVYLVLLLAPLAFLPLLAPRALLAAVPGLAINLLSLDPKLFNSRAQYQAFILPFLFLAAVEGWARLRARQPQVEAPRGLPATVVTAAFLLSIALTSRTVNDLGVRFWRLEAPQRAAYALLAKIPPDAAVSANERLVPHLATRPEIYAFPRGTARATYIVEITGMAARVPDTFTLVERREGWALWRRDGTR
ncbi:MAG: DUF2079 domain-containing protein [Candidatus Rokubacteria bacterium]|nr:DUF2079 domain-containing protein [Candidatus Rokubacteria bacterium]